MEGYFPIYQYCEITGCKKDTAYHRVLRGTVEAFKGQDGRWFVYFSDNREIPEGFVTTAEYSKIIGLNKRTVDTRIRLGYFNENDTITSIIIDDKGHPTKRRLIRKDTKWIDYRAESNKITSKKLMDFLKPEGTYTVPEYAKIVGRRSCTIYSRIKNGNIKFAKIEGHYFIYPEEEGTA